ncbi:MAG: HAMP domain-containing histidine kinase [Melioribacteraceae bacterium]|nr:HAMP domain-containing histidine kinase [Melioribacteraceae bacterium]MCF8354919.1 HAMP domain-containing histidine kinase [Melioribacteraceae bacterium]MCF8395244.1 HAMP domain-containing histidine kinase [Melioribacteraceae bacterium]MCF8420710.1 HAMP domain-containing histidine kinase [Melioribacteraceae bacterium]
MTNNIKHLFKTSLVKNAVSISLVILGFYLLFNLFAISKLSDLADHELDKKILHEINHIDQFVDFNFDSLYFHSTREFLEKDFIEITENPYFLQIYSRDGNVLFNSPNINKVGEIPIKQIEFNKSYYKENIDLDELKLRVIYSFVDNKDNAIIQLATTRSSISHLVQEFELFNLITLPIIVALIIFISIILSYRTYSGLNKIILTANRISAYNISERLDYKANKNDVYGKLKDTLNNLFTRLENQINHISEFTNNASHQLLSPLTAIKTELDFIRKKERDTKEYIETLNLLDHETEKMIKIIRTLLIIAKEADNQKNSNNIFNLSQLINNEIKARFFEYGIKYSIEESINLRGNPDYFIMTLNNLLDNSVKYSEADSRYISLTAKEIDNFIIIEVADQGIGIHASEKSKIFDRFYRGNNSDTTKGYGLGLSLVFVIVSQMKGTIEIFDNVPKGSIFRLKFPSISLD